LDLLLRPGEHSVDRDAAQERQGGCLAALCPEEEALDLRPEDAHRPAPIAWDAWVCARRGVAGDGADLRRPLADGVGK